LRLLNLQVWAEPFTRLPKLFNLRTDPYEFADITSNTYYDWFIHHTYFIYAAQAGARKFAETFKEFPAVQKPNTFTIDDAIALRKQAAVGAINLFNIQQQPKDAGMKSILFRKSARLYIPPVPLLSIMARTFRRLDRT
jgi:hypothetical protein